MFKQKGDGSIGLQLLNTLIKCTSCRYIVYVIWRVSKGIYIIFKAHGKYKLNLHNDVIILTVFGDWNLEGSIICIEDINKLIDTISGNRFAIVIDSSELTGLTKDSYVPWLKAINNWLQIGMYFTSRVDNPDSAEYKLFLSEFDDLLRSKTNFAYSSSIEDALSLIQNYSE